HSAVPSLDARLEFHVAPNARIDWNHALVLAGAFGQIEIAQGARLLCGLTGIDLSAETEADDARWQWLQAAVVGRLAGTPLARTAQVKRGAELDFSSAVSLQITLRSDRHAVSTYARAHIHTWLALMQDTAWTPERTPLSDWLDLSFETPVNIGRHTLPARLLRSVEPGDIILPDMPSFSCNGEASLQLGPWCVRARYEAPGLLNIINMEGKLNTDEMENEAGWEAEAGEAKVHVQESGAFASEPEGASNEPKSEDDASEGDTPAEAAATDRAPIQEERLGADETTDASVIDAVAVTLDFELGKARMLLRDLRTLGVGAIVAVKGGSPASIAIRAGGQTLGRGEAVDVDGRLGVRITQWGNLS
ncbi:MAG: FliM/FliN family flagellar motor switch protein, partial [Noviherbaspirillum sp.]